MEIISFVDARGEVTRQECHLDGACTIWDRGSPKPVSTGATVTDRRTSSPGLTQDPQLSPARLALALALLSKVPPGDRYLDHFRRELELASAGMNRDDEEAHLVTNFGAPPGAAMPARVSPGSGRAIAVGVAAALAVILLGAALWFWR